MEIRLNIIQYEFLKKYLGAERPDLFGCFNGGGSLVFEIDGEIAVEIRDWVGERMQMEGFDSNYELNENGLILVQLEDLLFE